MKRPLETENTTDDETIEIGKKKIKNCRKCEKDKCISEYYVHGAGHRPRCKSCTKEDVREAANRKREIPNEKKCCRCKKQKPITEFGTMSSTKDKHRPECKCCSKASKRTEACDFPSHKKCNKCGIEKSIELFGAEKSKRDGRRSECNLCRAPVFAARFTKEKDFRTELKLAAGGCANQEIANCNANPLDLVFAHFDRSNKHRSSKTGKPIQFSQLKIRQMKYELQFGRWLCMPCHAIETMEEIKEISAKVTSANSIASRERRQELHKYVNVIKQKIGSCQDTKCNSGWKIGHEPYSVFEFDHLDSNTKIDSISNLVRSGRPIVELDEEIQKCELVCAICHKRRTADRRKKVVNITPLPNDTIVSEVSTLKEIEQPDKKRLRIE